MSQQILDLLGVGVGPFNLSLAALIPKSEKVLFLDNKPEFSWHSELMFEDACMQTSYLKDLVTPVDPTSPYSFLNYLVAHDQFYHFLNTDRKTISRIEFEAYCKWVSIKLEERIEFDSMVEDIQFKEDRFRVFTKTREFDTKDLCIASGPQPNIPACVKDQIGPNIFHSKSPNFKNLNLQGKRVLIVGGGQTGVEIFRNTYKGKWGQPLEVTMVTGRDNLRPLDEGPFTNEVFTPDFVQNFYRLDQKTKDELTENLLLASDGNTPYYLQEVYNELYMDKFYRDQKTKISIKPARWLKQVETKGSNSVVSLENLLNKEIEILDVDIVVLATGFTSKLPSFMNSLENHLSLDSQGRLEFDQEYRLKTDLDRNNIYMMNFSRHGHGVADPQTSLMSWRSAIIANQVTGKDLYKTIPSKNTFLNFFN
ncbi:MAG: lysine 6-monooxygenase [Halobacteriovoraceae bacterium]|nr:lysine 6-monooxygenase [Halobacteriovoraceae bacterium]|tara:strand:- start:8607 stop:9875 length:1269 start_codon:yes stop_codon:yes gene_type:complete